MAFRNKAEIILKQRPDILIVPECEHPDRLNYKEEFMANDTFWHGDLVSKGIGVFAYGNYKIKLNKNFKEEYKFVLPLSVSNEKEEFSLFAIWAQKPEKHTNYIEQVWNAVHYYEDLLKLPNTILIGDFNSNTIWDKPRREINHSRLVEILANKQIVSTYHHSNKIEQGKETHPTLFMQRKFEKPYHIDFCFVSKDLLNKLSKVEVGEFKDWGIYSDHMPLTVTFKN